MKKLMKRTLFKKIFLIIFSAFLVVLASFTYITFNMQKQTESQYIYNSFNDHQIIKSLQNKLGVKEYNDEEDEPLDYSTSIKKIFDKEFQYEVDNNYRIPDGDFAVINRNFYSQRNNEIILSTFDKEDEYIELSNGKYSLDKIPRSKKESLLKYLKNHINDKDENYEPTLYLEYYVKNNQIVYLKWGNETYGQLTDKAKRSYIDDFHILDYILYRDLARDNLILVNVNDIKEAIQQLDYYIGQNGHYSMLEVNVNHQTFFISMGYIGGDYREGEGRTDKDFLNIINIGVADHFDEYVFKLCLQQNKWIYVVALFVLIFVSWCLSTIITYPISKIQQSALKIANNDFSEEVKIKSKDELGSLAESINTMRIQLKQTIEQLNQEIEHVKELESLRKDFINQFTHEMKTPLGIINGYSELIKEAENEEEVKKYLDVINRETSRVNQLIQSMLNLSRLEAGKVELVKEEIDLEDLVTEVVDEYEVLLMRKNAKVSIQTKNTIINGDIKQLKIVIQNFLSNAIKHVNTNGNIMIGIDQGVSVFNEGEKIKEEQIENIWYTFVTHEREGSGLGLAICRSILELQGYRYGVINQENGVKFYFYQ